VHIDYRIQSIDASEESLDVHFEGYGSRIDVLQDYLQNDCNLLIQLNNQN
jgi:hypothetical protein